jgi:hypothetical protein
MMIHLGQNAFGSAYPGTGVERREREREKRRV